MLRLSRALSVVVLAVASAVNAYSDPGPCSGACWAHDPAIIQRECDGKYYKFNTNHGIQIATASDLAGPWTLAGYVLPNGSSIDNAGNKDLWAPDVHLVDGVYHLYYAVSTFGTQVSAIGLATSSSLDAGTWTDMGGIGIASVVGDPYNALDPNLILVDDSYYLNFGSFWGDIFQTEMNSVATTASGSAYNIEFDSAGTRPCEGSYMFYNSDYYYLLWSHGVCCNYNVTQPAAGDEYMIKMCRSTSATGGFVDMNGVPCTESGGSILLQSHGNVYGPGGQGVFNDSSRGLVLYYHYANPTISLRDDMYVFGWNVLNWSSGWPSV